MIYHNNILCFEAGWLVDNGIMSLSNYKQLAHKRHLLVVRRASRATPALVSFDSLPDRFKRAVEQKIGGDPYRMARRNEVEELIEHDARISAFFDEYRLSDGRRLPKQAKAEYYANAIILNALHTYMDTVFAARRAKKQKTAGTWNMLCEEVQALDRTKYPHSLPAYHTRLRDRYNLYLREGAAALVHKNFSNRHAAKVDDQVKESLLIELAGDPRNLSDTRVARLYNEIARPLGWSTISSRTAAQYRQKYDLETCAGRRGAAALYNRRMMQVKRSAPSRPLYFWTLDGWDAELLYQGQKNGTTIYYNRPTIVVVLDPCCKYPVGYAVGTHETPNLIKAALRNAAIHTAELFGTMHRAHQIQSDRYALKTMMPGYEVMGRTVTPARAKNAKAKVVEPYFGHLNTTYCQTQLNWSGFGITSAPGRQPNSEFLNRYKNRFPDYDGVCAQLDTFIRAERLAKRDEYLRLWSLTPDEDRLRLSTESYLRYFGETTGRTNLLRPDGLHVTIGGVKRTYDCFDIEFRRHAATRWTVTYDPADTSRILVSDRNETLSFMLEQKHVQPMALRERTDDDSRQLARVNRFNEELKMHITETRAAAGEAVRELLDRNAGKIEGTLAKLMLTDARGQHKNHRYAERSLDTHCGAVQMHDAGVSPGDVLPEPVPRSVEEIIRDII